MTSTTPSEAFARAEAFASVHRRMLSSQEKVRFGRFTLIRPLGRGAHGRVYLAFDPTLQRDVALKLISAQGEAAVRRGLREGRALARLRHPSLVQIHDVVHDGDAIGLAMELVDGATLREWSRTKRPTSETIDVLLSVGRGLAALHAAGLVHRDVKPANVVVDRVLGPRIIDLGLATDIADTATRRLRSGTPGYLAPEQIDGIEVGPAADQYAWSVMVWETLCGSKPIVGRARPKAIPRRLAPILRRGLAVQPEHRYPSLTSMLEEVEDWRRSSRWARVGAGVLAGGLLVAGLQFAVLPRNSCDQPDAELTDLWSPSQSAAMERRLAGLAAPTAPELARRITEELDADQIALVQTQRWVCEEQVNGNPMSDEAFCLRQAAAEFATTVETLGTLDAASLPDGADLLARMSPPHACQLRPGARPSGPDSADLRELARLRGTLQGVANACPLLGPEACTERFAELTADPVAEGTCALEPIALFEHGRGLMNAGKPDEAFELLTKAAWSAESCGAGPLEFTAKRHSAALAARQGNLEQATWWLASAEAAHRRTGENDFRRGELALTRGTVTALEGNPRQSVEVLREAVELLETQADTAGPTLAVAYVNLGQSARQAGLYQDAVDAIERGLALTRARLGPTHPTVGRTLISLAIAQHQAAQVEAAAQTATEAIAVFEPWEQRYPLDLSQALNNRGLMQRAAGDLVNARASFERALTVLARALGPDHPSYIRAQHNLGGTEAMLGEVERAAKTLQDALAKAQRHWPEPHPETDRIAISLANVRLEREQFEPAAVLACPACERARERYGDTHPSTVRAAALCATANEARGEHAAVVEAFAPIVKSIAPLASSVDRGALRLAVSKSMLALGRRDHALALARQAQADVEQDAAARQEVKSLIAQASEGPRRSGPLLTK